MKSDGDILNTPLLTIRPGVVCAQAAGCWGYVQVGTLALFLGWTRERAVSRRPGWRLVLCAPGQRFAWNRAR